MRTIAIFFLAWSACSFLCGVFVGKCITFGTGETYESDARAVNLRRAAGARR